MTIDLSIITVCYNDKVNTLSTVKSVVSFKQLTSLSVEHIVQDGGSNDGIESELSGYDISFESKQDNGIYEGMNNALTRISGKYIWFLNAGDTIHSELLTTDGMKSFEGAIFSNSAKLSFNVLNVRFNKIYTWRKSNSLKKNAMLHHQGTLINVSKCYDNLFFDSKYLYRGDYEFFLRIAHLDTKALDVCICSYDGYGVSTDDRNAVRFFLEEYEIDEKYNIRRYRFRWVMHISIRAKVLMRKVKRFAKVMFCLVK